MYIKLVNKYGIKLVVVGDQSSGKSSVLEGLTGIPFPRDSSLCTRFATQIVFSRAEKESISVSIIPSANCNAALADELKAFRVDDLTELSAEDFIDILADVYIAPAMRSHLLKLFIRHATRWVSLPQAKK